MSLGGLILLSLALGAGAWLLFMWSVKTGQYEDPEGPKYRMLDDDDPPAPAPPRVPRAPAPEPPRPGAPMEEDEPSSRRSLGKERLS